MEREFKGICKQGNYVSMVCTNICCQHHPLICNKQCLCYNNHIMCYTESIKKIEESMEQKKRQLLPLYQIIGQWYEQNIKNLQRHHQVIKEAMFKTSQILNENEKRLCILLKQGPFDDITSELIATVMNSLQLIPEININQIRQELEAKSQQLIRITEYVSNIKKLHSNNNIVNLNNFSQKMHHEDINTNDSKIQMSKTNNFYCSALLQNSVESFNNLKPQLYRYKVSQSYRNWIMFGFCHLKQCINKRYQNNYDTNDGGYVINSYDGNIYTHKEQLIQRDVNRIMNIKTGDQVHLIYNSTNNKVNIINVTSNQRDTFQLTKQAGNPIHPYVMIRDQNDIVEFLGMSFL